MASRLDQLDKLLSSDQSDDLKRGLSYNYIIRTVQEPLTLLECRQVFLKLVEWACSSQHSFLRENALEGFDRLADKSLSVFLGSIDGEFFNNIFTKHHEYPVSVVGLLVIIFTKFRMNGSNIITSIPKIRLNLVMYISQHGHNLSFVQSLEHLYTMFPILLPLESREVTLLGNIIIHLHSSHQSLCQCDAKLVKLLTNVWRMCENIVPCFDTLDTFYQVLTASDISSPPACLAMILETLPDTCEEQCFLYLLDPYLPSHKLLLLLTRVLAWIEVRESPSLTAAILTFLPLLGSVRGNLVLRLSQACLVRMIQQVTQVESIVCKQQLVVVVLCLLYGDQESVILFQSVLPWLPAVVQNLEAVELFRYQMQIVEMVLYFEVLYPGILDGTSMSAILLEEEFTDLSPERKHQLARWAWRYPGYIRLDRRPGQLVGLVNLGNTCYLNSILQALFCTEMFQGMVIARSTNKTQPFLHGLQRIFRCMSLSRRASTCPREFLGVSRPPWFDIGYQQDCSEFLTFLLHSLDEEEEKEKMLHEVLRSIIKEHEDSVIFSTAGSIGQEDSDNKSRNPSNSSLDSGVESGGESCPSPTIVQSVFGGELDTAYKCLDCNSISHVVTRFTILNLPISSTTNNPMPYLPNLPSISITRTRNKLSVNDLLRNYFQPENLEGENQYHCNHCLRLRNAVKTTQIKVAPKHLVVTLLRFKYDNATSRKVKLTRSIDCPRIVNLIVGEGMVRYNLYCVVVHFGLSSEGGHYYTLVRVKEEWLKVSDEEVEMASSTWNQEGLGRRDTPYMLFYLREDST